MFLALIIHLFASNDLDRSPPRLLETMLMASTLVCRGQVPEFGFHDYTGESLVS